MPFIGFGASFESQKRGTGLTQQGSGYMGLQGMRIALVDDDPDEIADIAATLRASGTDCSLYSSGEELLAALRRETFDLLLLDWNMMGM